MYRISGYVYDFGKMWIVATIEKSNSYFVISNFNHDPMPLTSYAKNYEIFDQSNDHEIRRYLEGLRDPRVKFSKHEGHNIIDYLNWIIDNWNNLPEVVVFAKGNMVGRHIDKKYWEKIYLNKHYTFVYNNEFLSDTENQFVGWSSDFSEINNSWFISHSKHRFFTDTNQLIEFLYKKPRFPRFLTFSPGACYIVEKSRILNKPLSLWIGLREILNYDFFPSEAWIVERLLHTIFFSEQDFQDYVYEKEKMLKAISELPDRSAEKVIIEKSRTEVLRSKVFWKAKSLFR